MEFELEFEFESEIEFSFEIEFEPNAPALEKILSVPDRSIFRSKMESRMSPTWTPECLQNDSKMTPLGDPQREPKMDQLNNKSKTTVPLGIARKSEGLVTPGTAAHPPSPSPLFFINAPATTASYTLSQLADLPIYLAETEIDFVYNRSKRRMNPK